MFPEIIPKKKLRKKKEKITNMKAVSDCSLV
jgi:hypothetical protein